MTLLIPSVPQTVVLSPSRVEGGLRCLRKHTLAEILGIQPNDHSTPALDFGDVMHRGIGRYWRGNRDLSGALEELAHAVEWPLNTTHTHALAVKLIDVYASEARLMPYGDPNEWEVVTLEERRYLEVAGDTLAFQIDRLLQNSITGEFAFVDLKTANKCDRRWEIKWPRSIQMKLYAECIEREYGKAPQWLIIEGLEKTKPHVHYITLDFSEEVRKEALQAYKWVAKHDGQLLDACRDKDGVVEIDRLLQRGLTETPFSEAECWSYNTPCPYLPLCDAEPSQRIALLNADYHYEAPKHLV